MNGTGDELAEGQIRRLGRVYFWLALVLAALIVLGIALFVLAIYFPPT